ncbi:MAG: M48 family metalloprotease [Acidobacteria bacterium]|nr:M48 family metalloprotease [Acidobacteriota bacterium]
MARRRKTFIDSSALTAIVPVLALLPAWLSAMSLIWVVVAIPFDTSYVTFIGTAALASVVMFLPATQRIFVTRMLGVRTPERDERRRLDTAARMVLAAARTPKRRFVFAIDESSDVNAFACGGHMLVVSSFALDKLDDDELLGVVAHEFSHHLGAHTVGLSFAQWFSLPVLLFARLGEFTRKVARSPLRRLEAMEGAARHIARALDVVLRGFSWLFGATLVTAQRLNDLVGRDAEFHADRRVVELGFGRQLSRALTHVAARDGSSIGRSRHERIFSSHPPARTRIARIEALLRSRSR